MSVHVRGIRLGWRDWLIIAVAASVAVVFGWTTNQIGVMRAQNDALVTALSQQRQQAQDSGQEPVAPPPADILENPAVVQGPPGERGESGPAGPPPSDAQVYEAVAAYFRTNPPGPTPAEIAASVASYLSLHPPAAGPAGPQGQAGQNATADQVADAVRAYLTANPPPAGPKGEQGERGEQGPAPTADALADAVRAYLKEHPLPVCPAGAHIEEYNPPLDNRTFLVCVKD